MNEDYCFFRKFIPNHRNEIEKKSFVVLPKILILNRN